MTKKNKRVKLFVVLILTLLLSQNNSYSQEVVAAVEEEKKYKGSLDFGATFANGNSKEQSIQSNLEVDYQISKKISNTFKARAENKKQNNVRTREKYYVDNQTRRDLSEFNFKFFELEYVSDRYGGYHYRTSETAGVGRTLIDNKKNQLSIQSSAGMRQSKLTTKDKSNDIIIRFASNFTTKINEHLSFDEAFDISFDQNATITRSDSNLKILVSKKLYFKFGVLIEHVTRVPEGSKNSDVTTSLKLGYEF